MLLQRLPKLLDKQESDVLHDILTAFEYTSLWQLQMVSDTGSVVKIDAQQHLFLYVGISVLFPQRVVTDYEDVRINLERALFHECHKEWTSLLKACHVTHEFTDKQVHIYESDISVDFEKFTDEKSVPEIKIGDITYDEEALQELQTNIWTTTTDQTITVLDPKIVKKCEAILNVIQDSGG